MPDRVHTIMITALWAAQNGRQPMQTIEQSILGGDLSFPLERLEFDSIAWMEFCISIELQTRQELLPAHIESMRRIADIETWLRSRI